MLQFPAFAVLTDLKGSPIRRSRVQPLRAGTPGLLQLVTSFIADVSQAIRRAALVLFSLL